MTTRPRVCVRVRPGESDQSDQSDQSDSSDKSDGSGAERARVAEQWHRERWAGVLDQE